MKRAAFVLALLPLGGCSALMVGEVGISHRTSPADTGVVAAVHAGAGTSAAANDQSLAYGLGFSGRVRTYGGSLTALEPGLHVYLLMDRGPLSFYLRETNYVGLTFGEGSVGAVFSPTVQPGVLLCNDSRAALCGSLSLPFGYDVGIDAPSSFHVGVSFGIGWGNVVSDEALPHRLR